MYLAAVIFIGNGVLHVLAWVEWLACWRIVRSDVGSVGSVGSSFLTDRFIQKLIPKIPKK